MSPRPAAVVVLAAGEGTRMRSATPKVLHEISGRSLVGHVVAASRELDPQHLVVVVGHASEQVTAHLNQVQRDSGADELMIGSVGHSVQARLRSTELIADAYGMPGHSH